MALLSIGSGLLMVMSLCLPYYQAPIEGSRHFQLLSVVTVAFGAAALIRQERGPVVVGAVVMSVMAGVLFALMVLGPLAYVITMRLLMPD